MERRKWDATTEATIVREGLKGKPVGAICQRGGPIGLDSMFHFLSGASQWTASSWCWPGTPGKSLATMRAFRAKRRTGLLP